MFDRFVLVFYSAFIRPRIEIKCVPFFLQFLLWGYQVIIMIRKHGDVSRSQL